MDLITTITYSSGMNSRSNNENFKSLEQLFKQIVGNEKEIKRDDFNKILLSKNPFFTERVFQIFDRDNSGSISLCEFLDAIHEYAGQTPDDKLRFLFKVYDIDGDGLIQQQELQNVMQACMKENGMHFSKNQLKNLTLALFEDADSESKGAITYDALKNQLQKHDGLLENLSISIDRWLIPPKPKQSLTSTWERFTSLIPYQLTLQYMRNNYVYLTFLALYVFFNAVLFGIRIYQYRNNNYYTIFARACGQCLNFNCAFILVLMLRHCITFFRTRGFSIFLPIDQHIYFHKIIGYFIFGYSILHTIMHVLNFSTVIVYDPNLNYEGFTVSEWLFTTDPGAFGLIGGYANPTGVVLIVILFVMFICSQPFVRRSGYFEIFYWTHLLYVPFFILLILHCPNYWKWLMIPGFLYLCERVYRFSLTHSEHGKTYISTSVLLPSKVTHLVIKRSPHFDFRPGDYVFVNIPAIAKYEWHPFTISSAPEQEDYIWLHIRGVGGWTDRLYSYIKEQHRIHNLLNKEMTLSTENSQTSLVSTNESSKVKWNVARTSSGKATADAIRVKYKTLDDFTPKNRNSSNLQEHAITIENTSDLESIESHDEINSNQVAITNPRLEIYLMGPYGTPSSHIFRAQHAVMIATGIGVTPFASILQSIMHRYWKARHTCPKCKYTCASEIPSTVMRLRKVDFFWINRDQSSFEWFVNLLSQLEIEQAELGETMERFLDMYMYITSALQKTDMKAVGLQLALDLLHKKEKRDLITGLKTRTHAGRPNWDEVFKQLLDQKKGKITVFFCGPPQLGKLLRVKCHQFGFDFRKEVF